MIFKKNISEIFSNYDYFILDIWGVVHDGTHLYPNVLNSLAQLKSQGKKICFLSNAPRRAFRVEEILDKLGVTKELYDFILTSGEATYLFLEQNYNHKNLLDLLQKSLKNKNNPYHYYYIGPKKDADLLDGLGYHQSYNAKEADFAVTTGFDDDDYKIESKMAQLQAAKEANLTLICVNPDLIVVKQNGKELLCAGVIAAKYNEMGGSVRYFGKPYSLVYEQVFKLFNIKDKKDQKKILAIGDGIETDILGANNFGIDSAFVASGICAKELKIDYGQLPSAEIMQQFCQKYKIYPNYVVSTL